MAENKYQYFCPYCKQCSECQDDPPLFHLRCPECECTLVAVGNRKSGNKKLDGESNS